MSSTPSNPSQDTQPATDDALSTFKLSSQSSRVVSLVEDNKLNQTAGYDIDALIDNLKQFEVTISGQRVKAENKTAGLLGVVERTAHEHALTDIDINDPANGKMVAGVANEIQAVARAIYDDPITNPLHRDLGGYYDIDKAKKSFAMGRRSNPANFSPNILIKNQLLLVNAVNTMPAHLQQLAMQGARQAAKDASTMKHYAGQKTDTVHYVKATIESNLRSYDTFNRTVGYQPIVGGQEQAFDRAMYDAKGARQHASSKGDRTLASNKPPVQITTESKDAYSKMMIDGLNAESQNIHNAYRKPHTFDGDIELNHQVLNMLDNVQGFSEYLNDRVVDDNRDRMEGRELNQLHKQTKALVDNVLELSKELPFRDLELSRTAERAKEDLESKNALFQRAEQETVYREAQEANHTTVRSVPRRRTV